MDNGASSYRRFLEGDKQGLYELICEYRIPLMLYLNSIVQNMHTAEELTEDTFFELASRRPSFSEKSSFKTWLFSIGRNIAAKQFRNNPNEIILSSEVYEQIPDEESIESSYFKNERDIHIHKALDALNSDYRQILYLTYFEDLSNDQAAAVMKKNKRQIRNLLYNAKKALKAELERSGFDYEE
ncbi:MAG: RNA polymerase sigma factor [Ruminococcus sp.]|nr:RNA polymerase sigma factor [Ruminococcus sp.]